MVRALTGTILLLMCASVGCGWITGSSPPKRTTDRESVYVDDSGLTAKKSGIDLDELLDRLPADLRENLCHNELRRKRANQWLAANVVGTTLEIDCKAVEVAVDEVPPGKYWVRFWLEEAETTILGEPVIYSVGPGCTPDALLFPPTAEGFAMTYAHAMIFAGEQPNPSHALLILDDAATAEGLADFRGNNVKLRGAIRECAFYPEKLGAAGGFKIRLAKATLNDLPVVPSLPVTDAPTNPWEIAYEPVPIGADAERLFADAKLDGGDGDANAEQWTDESRYALAGSLEGQWSGRWQTGESSEWRLATAPVDAVVRDDRLLMRFTDELGTYLIVLRKGADGAYVGRYLNVAAPAVCSPFATRVVSPERIDGAWINAEGKISRWDFRRQVSVIEDDPNSLSSYLEEQERERQRTEK